MIFCITHDCNAATVFAHQIALGHAFFRIVGTFSLNVGVNLVNESADIPLWEDDDCIDIGKSRENFGAFCSGHDGSTLAFERPYGVIGIYSDDQASTEILGGVQIANVAHVQDVKAAIRQGHSFACCAPLCNAAPQLIAVQNLRIGRRIQWFRIAGGAFIIAWSSSFRVTVAVPRFITTIPPA